MPRWKTFFKILVDFRYLNEGKHRIWAIFSKQISLKSVKTDFEMRKLPVFGVIT
jgi:hypothetical protein